ncbi:MAG: 2OG-Fe(II) oxygenase [Ilumatobacteraceae bacterium]
MSASVKLNESYEGAELEFPRQGFSNKDLRVGDIVVWPSLVTHPHRSTPLVSGTKYSLTLWFELPMQIT